MIFLLRVLYQHLRHILRTHYMCPRVARAIQFFLPFELISSDPTGISTLPLDPGQGQEGPTWVITTLMPEIQHARRSQCMVIESIAEAVVIPHNVLQSMCYVLKQILTVNRAHDPPELCLWLIWVFLHVSFTPQWRLGRISAGETSIYLTPVMCAI